MIGKIEIENFKSIKHTSITLDRLNMLIGANASGKSNLIEVFSFIKFLASGQKLTDLVRDNSLERLGVRGTTMGVLRDGISTLKITAQLKNGPLNQSVYSILISKKGINELGIVSEKSSDSKGANIYTMTSEVNSDKTSISFEYNDKNDGLVTTDSISGHNYIPAFIQFTQGLYKDDAEKLWTFILKMSKFIEINFSKIEVINTVPSLMRNYWQIGGKSLQSNCQNISSVLYHLLVEADNKITNKETILSFIKSLPEQDVLDIGLIKTERNDVMLKIEEKRGSNTKWFDVTQLSDGTLRMISYAVALLSVPEESLLILEEIDNGIHPSRANYLLKEIDRISSERNLTILMSSHNPAIIDAMPLGRDTNISFCYRDIDDGSTKVVSLEELDNYPDMILRDTIGNLLTKGELDTMVKKPITKKQRVSDGLKWLETVK